MQSLVVALALSTANALVARTLPAARPRAQRSSVKMELIMPEKDFLIAPSILSADFAKLGAEVDASLAAGADVVHFDVMDNHYVPNLTIGPMVCSALRKHGVTAPIDVHLMVSPVDRIVQDFADAGASYITFHPEASPHVDRTLQLIRSTGCKSGLVFNPATPLDILKYVMDKVDIILLMSVNPGFGGQAFIPATLDKAREARKMIDESGYDIRLEIDGGVRSRRPAVLCAFTPSTRLVSIRRPFGPRRATAMLRTGLGREHQRSGGSGRRHVRRRLGHLPRPAHRGGLQKDDRRHARRARGGQGAGEQGRGLGFAFAW